MLVILTFSKAKSVRQYLLLGSALHYASILDHLGLPEAALSGLLSFDDLHNRGYSLRLKRDWILQVRER